MHDFYTPTQRQLQDEFDTRALADRLEAAIVSEALSEDQVDFVHARDMFFLSTIDESGFPSCSYKGGAPGFVRVLNDHTLAFPSYDGNGMFMSMGNIEAQSRIGMLFVDFASPQRLRLRGAARLLRQGKIYESFHGADIVVEVAIERAWQNCPRYVHKMHSVNASPHVPAADGTTRFALWKCIDVMQDVLSAADRAEAQRVGLITANEYEARVQRGET